MKLKDLNLDSDSIAFSYSLPKHSCLWSGHSARSGCFQSTPKMYQSDIKVHYFFKFIFNFFFCYCFLKSKFKQRDKDASWVSALYDKKRNRPLFLDRSKERKMANLSMESLPVGIRFSPMDEELVNHYLRLKNEGHDSGVQVIAEVDFYKFDPWELPGTLFFFPRLILCFSEYLSSSVLFKEILFSGVFLAFIC